MESDFNQSNSKRKKVLQVVLPACFAFLSGLFIYQYWSQKKGDKKEENRITLPAVNSSTPNRPLTDSFMTKQEVYTAQSDAQNIEKQKKEEFSKGSDKFGKVNTNVLGEANSKTLQTRLNSEVVKPINDADKKSPIHNALATETEANKQDLSRVNTDNDVPMKRGFNSFVMKKVAAKENSYPAKEYKDQGTAINPSNNGADINCAANITAKSKISSRGSVMITIQDNLSIPGGINLSAGTEIAARASVMDERVMLEIESANINGKIVKLALKAYDLDGMEGLYVKNAKLQKSASSSTNNTISNVSSLGESAFGIPGQLAGGIIRGIAGGGGGTGSVTLPEGYKMILKSKF